MLRSRRFADLLTGMRALIAFSLPWIGYRLGARAVPLVVYLLLFGWISDYFDGVIARQSPGKETSWIGKHDLEVDIAVSGGLLIYLLAADFVSPLIASLYVLFWAFIFIVYGIGKASGSLVQAPVYGRFLWVAGHLAPQAAVWVLVWVVANLVFTWRRFAYEVLPEFFADLGKVLRRK